MNPEKLKWDFGYHAPDQAKRMQHEDMRDAFLYLAQTIDREAPDCREKSLAITKLEEAMMWANAAIARNPRPEGTK